MVGTAIARGIHSAMSIRITKQIGVGSMGGVIVILTRGMVEWLNYEILARYRVILVEHLGGLFFGGRRSCTEDSVVGRSGLYRSRSLVVSMLIM